MRVCGRAEVQRSGCSGPARVGRELTGRRPPSERPPGRGPGCAQPLARPDPLQRPQSRRSPGRRAPYGRPPGLPSLPGRHREPGRARAGRGHPERSAGGRCALAPRGARRVCGAGTGAKTRFRPSAARAPPALLADLDVPPNLGRQRGTTAPRRSGIRANHFPARPGAPGGQSSSLAGRESWDRENGGTRRCPPDMQGH